MVTKYVSFNRPKVTAIQMTEGPFMFKSFQGSWTFTPLGEQGTEVKFIYSFCLRFPFNLVPFVIKTNLKRLMEIYDLYYNGYSFLKDLGLGIGLTIKCPTLINFSADSWDELSRKQQEKLLEILSPELEIGVERVIDWLESKKIILTGEQDELGHYQYEDFRTEEEKKSRLWVMVSENKASGGAISTNILWERQPEKKWWEFWKRASRGR